MWLDTPHHFLVSRLLIGGRIAEDSLGSMMTSKIGFPRNRFGYFFSDRYSLAYSMTTYHAFSGLYTSYLLRAGFSKTVTWFVDK